MKPTKNLLGAKWRLARARDKLTKFSKGE